MKIKILSMITVITFILSFFTVLSFAAYQTIDVAGMITDKENWTGTWTADDTRISETTIGDDYVELAGRNIKSATNPEYTGQDFRFDYKLKVTWPEDAYDWGCIVTFHDKDVGMHVWEQGRNATYGVFYKLDSSIEDITKSGSVSIAKWNQPDTHNGDPEGIGDGSEITGLDLSGKENIYNLFVEDVANGVHITLYMNGALIIDVTDTGTVKNEIDSNPITGEGGFTILQHAPRTVVFSTVKAGEQPVLQTPTPSPTSAVSSQVSSVSSSAASSSAGSIASSEQSSSEEVQSEDASILSGSGVESVINDSSLSSESPAPTDEPFSSSSSSENNETDGISTGLIIAIAVLIIIAGGTAGAFIIMKKKKKS